MYWQLRTECDNKLNVAGYLQSLYQSLSSCMCWCESRIGGLSTNLSLDLSLLAMPSAYIVSHVDILTARALSVIGCHIMIAVRRPLVNK